MRLPEFENIDVFPQGQENSPDVYFSLLMRPFFRRKLKLLIELLPESVPAGRALEVGYGCGIALKELSHRFDKVAALDIHGHEDKVEQMLDGESIENVDLYHHDIFRQPFQNGGAFDYVFSSSVMEHIPFADLKEGIRNIHAVTRKGGHLVVGFPVCAPATDIMFLLHENIYMRLRSLYAPVSDFSNKSSHISGHDEIMAALSGCFEVEEQRYFSRALKLYLVLRCRRAD